MFHPLPQGTQRLSSFRVEKPLHRLLYYGVSSNAKTVDYHRAELLASMYADAIKDMENCKYNRNI